MSTLPKTNSSQGIAFNTKAASSVGWGGNIPAQLIARFPDLAADPSTEQFRQGVAQLQTALYPDNPSQVDGMLGKGTWLKALATFDHVADDSAYLVFNGRRVSVDSDTQIINFDQPKGQDLHKIGHFSKRRNKPTILVVHWGGLNPKHCYDIFCDPDRKVSSHGGIGLNNQGQPTFYQWLDLQHTSWHAGWVNSISVGIDICQQPELKWSNLYRSEGYILEEQDNKTGRGPSRVLSLEARNILAVRDTIKSICAVLDIPMRVPRGANGKALEGDFYHGVLDQEWVLSGGFSGVVGHHHISEKKWDCACWWDDLFSEQA